MKSVKRKAYTVADLGKTLGLSPMTVSRALRGLPSVREDTREKVLALAREKGLLGPGSGTSPSGPRARQVAFYFPEHLLVEHGDLPYWSRLYFQFKKHLAAHGIEGVPVELDRGDGIGALDRLPLLVLFTQPAAAGKNALAGLRQDLMILGVQQAARSGLVGIDHETALDRLAEDLVRSGHRHLAILGHLSGPEVGTRHETLRRAVLAREPRARIDFIPCPYLDLPLAERDGFFVQTLSNYFQSCDALPTALFATDVHGTLMAWKFFRQNLGIGVPQQIGLAGFDRSPVYDHLEPDITRVEFPVEEVARATADQCFLALQSGRLPPRLLAVPATFHRGRSLMAVSDMRPPTLKHLQERLHYVTRLTADAGSAEPSTPIAAPTPVEGAAHGESVHVISRGAGRRGWVLSVPAPKAPVKKKK